MADVEEVERMPDTEEFGQPSVPQLEENLANGEPVDRGKIETSPFSFQRIRPLSSFLVVRSAATKSADTIPGTGAAAACPCATKAAGARMPET